MFVGILLPLYCSVVCLLTTQPCLNLVKAAAAPVDVAAAVV
jgi:hypothetical protein